MGITSEVGVRGRAAGCDSVSGSCICYLRPPWAEEQRHLQLTTMVSFCWYPENLGEIELNDNGIICLEEEISSQEGIQAGAEMLHWDSRKGVLRAKPHLSGAPHCDIQIPFEGKKPNQKGFAILQRQLPREVSPQGQHTEADTDVALGGQARPQAGNKTQQSHLHCSWAQKTQG